MNVVVGPASVEAIFSLETPLGRLGPPFHVAARTLMERSHPGWRHSPPYPRVPFGTGRPFEMTVLEIAALFRAAHAAIASVAWS